MEKIALSGVTALLIAVVASANNGRVESTKTNPTVSVPSKGGNQVTGGAKTDTKTGANNASNSGTNIGNKTTVKPVEDPNASKLQSALKSKDYVTVRKLADSGYSPAYLPMAEYYVKTPSTHDLADKYAQKAKTAGIKGAQKVIDDLQSMGYYE